MNQLEPKKEIQNTKNPILWNVDKLSNIWDHFKIKLKL